MKKLRSCVVGMSVKSFLEKCLYKKINVHEMLIIELLYYDAEKHTAHEPQSWIV